MCDEDRARAALDHFRVATRVAFSTSMAANPMSPIAAMRIAAMALGGLYRELAVAHCRAAGGCSCGWRPHAAADVEAMLAALSAGAYAPAEPVTSDLLSVKIVGNA